MKLKKTFIYYTDPGHGWVKVPLKLIAKYCPEFNFSFSFMRGEYAYLEEDCDAIRFLDIYANAHDINRKTEFKIIVKHTNKRSKIRNYNYYNKGILNV